MRKSVPTRKHVVCVLIIHHMTLPIPIEARHLRLAQPVVENQSSNVQA